MRAIASIIILMALVPPSAAFALTALDIFSANPTADLIVAVGAILTVYAIGLKAVVRWLARWSARFPLQGEASE